MSSGKKETRKWDREKGGQTEGDRRTGLLHSLAKLTDEPFNRLNDPILWH